MEAAARKLPRGALGMDALTTEHYAGKRPARHFKGFKGFEAWQTAGLNALTTEACLRSWAFCMREWRVVALLGYLFPAELGGLVEGVERLEPLRPGKWQP